MSCSLSTSSKKVSQITKSTNRCPVFGSPQKLSEMKLQTYCEVMKHYTFVLQDLTSNKINSKENACVTEVATSVTDKLETIGQIALIPTVPRKRIVHKVKDNHDKHRNY